MLVNSSCLWVANIQATLFRWITLNIRRNSGWIVSFPICGSFKHNVGTEGNDKLLGNVCGGHRMKATIKYHGNCSITFGISFGTGISTSAAILLHIFNIYSVSQKWVHPSHFCRYLSISLHGTTLTKWHFDTMKSSLRAAYITELIYFPLKITQNITIKS